jgi:selenocysteine lyase/cysteine desulfurase
MPATTTAVFTERRDSVNRGRTVAFNVVDRLGTVVPFRLVERRADAAGVQVRGGCVCNPGAAEAALGVDGERLARADAPDRRAAVVRVRHLRVPAVPATLCRIGGRDAVDQEPLSLNATRDLPPAYGV